MRGHGPLFLKGASNAPPPEPSPPRGRWVRRIRMRWPPPSVPPPANAENAIPPHQSAYADRCLAAARSRRGSDMPPVCHSLPRRRFASLKGRPLADALLLSLPLEGKVGPKDPDEVAPAACSAPGERAVPHRSTKINFHLISQLTLTGVSLRLGQGRVRISTGDPFNTGPFLRKPS